MRAVLSALVLAGLVVACGTARSATADGGAPSSADASPMDDATADAAVACTRTRGVVTGILRFGDTPGLSSGSVRRAVSIGDRAYVATDDAIWRSSAPSTPAVKVAKITGVVDGLVAYGGGIWWSRETAAPTACPCSGDPSCTCSGSTVYAPSVVERLDEASLQVASFSLEDSACSTGTSLINLSSTDAGVVAISRCAWGVSFDGARLTKRLISSTPVVADSGSAVHGDNLYFASASGLVEAGLSLPHERVIPWKSQFAALPRNFVVDDDSIYVIAPSVTVQEVRVYALSDGSATRTLPIAVGPGSLFLVGSTLVASAYDAQHGNAAWRVSKQDGQTDLLASGLAYDADDCALYLSSYDGLTYFAP